MRIMNPWAEIVEILDVCDRKHDPYASDEELLQQIRSKIEMILECPHCNTQMDRYEGCLLCKMCGYSRG